MQRDSHLWLKETGQLKQLNRHDNFGCLIPAFLWLLALVSLGAALGSAGKYWWLPLVPAGIAVVSRKFAERIFLHKIFCPECGYNPTRRKSDGKPREDRSKVRAQLERYVECPMCGIGEGRSP